MDIMYDCIVIGAGPAGVTSALYLSRFNKKVLVLEKEMVGGQINNSPKVENIPGILSISGADYACLLNDQLDYNKIPVSYEEVIDVTCKLDENGNRIVFVKTSEENIYQSRTIIIASGTKHRLLGLPGEEDLIGNGISFCVMCDGAFYKDKAVAVIGGGNSALQEALELSDIAKEVYILQNLKTLTGEERLQDSIKEKDNITVITDCKITSYVIGDDGYFKGLKYEKAALNFELNVDGVFLAIGLVPNNDAFNKVIDIDDTGYISAINTFSGVFAAGDCLKGVTRQVVVAQSSGAEAAIWAKNYLESRNL